MKSKILFFALLCLLSGLFSCKEPTEDIVQPIPKIREIKVYRNDTLSVTNTYEYNSEGKILKITSSSGYSETYTHEAGKITRTVQYPDHQNTDVFMLNNRGLVIAVNGSGETFEYDQEGYLTNDSLVAVHKFTILNGNTIKREIWKEKSGTPRLLAVFDYDFLTDRPNTVGNENMGITWLGKQDKNLVSEENYHDPERQIDLSFTYQYEFDSQNRVSKSSYSYYPNSYKTFTYYE